MPEKLSLFIVRWIFAVASVVLWVSSVWAFILGFQPFAVFMALFALIATFAWGIAEAGAGRL